MNKMFRNLTPHPIVVRTSEGDKIFPPEGMVPRVKMSTISLGMVDGIEFRHTQYGEVEGLPEFEVGTFLIVSGMIKDRFPDSRSDLVSPDTGPTAIRDESGRIVAVTGFRN